MAKASRTARSVLWIIHRWIGIGLFVLLVPVALSGAALVFDDVLDPLIHPARYATTGDTLLAPSVYLASAGKALGGTPSGLRLPAEAGAPVIVQARSAGVEGGAPKLFNVYIDPPTGSVLEIVDFRSSLFGFLHVFHENLAMPQYSGRAIVGWTGVGMLVLALSGIVLWWPRNGEFIPGLRWRRAPVTSNNLHHLAGFWISLPLAFVSLTGIYLAFPPQARSVMSSIAPMAPQGPRGFGAPVRQTALTADSALDAALKAEPGARAAAVFLPVAARREAANGAAAVWRVQLRKNDETLTVLVNDRSGDVVRAAAPKSGDRAAQWIRWLHEGSHSGGVWRAVVFVTGILPAVLGFTGVMMWLRRRRNRKASRNDATIKRAPGASGSLQAAE
jgi:uncharacterized iron-regulated membrane protein